jgi:hypothetical protein
MMRNRLAVHIDFKDINGLMGKRVPSNIDMIMERHGHFLIGEWKRDNEKISVGQQILLKQLARVNKFTVIVINGDTDNGMVIKKFWQLNKDETFTVLGKSTQDFKNYLLKWDKSANNLDK